MVPYQILDRNIPFKGAAFEVHQLKIRLPDGRSHTFDLVEHRDSVSVVPVDGEGNLLFVSQYRVGAVADLLELPAGVLEEGENPHDGAGREIREETGLAAGRLVELGKAYLAPGYSTECMYFFLATALYPSPLEADADEFISLVRIPLDEAYRMARAGEFQDSKTLAALLLAESHIFPLTAK
jgi:ADP-ribose pyrophosphatase